MPKKKPPLVYTYNRDKFDPPAPALEVSLSIPIPSLSDQIVKSPALIDTGADITSIPIWIVEELKLTRIDITKVRGYSDTEDKPTNVYTVKIHIENLGDFIIRTIASYDNYVLVGRDILNKWSLFLKGPSEIFEIS